MPTAMTSQVARPVCKGCNGEGRVGNALEDAECPFCNGSGDEPQDDVADRLYYGAECPVSGLGGDLADDMRAGAALIKHLRGLLREALDYVEGDYMPTEAKSIEAKSLAERMRRLDVPQPQEGLVPARQLDFALGLLASLRDETTPVLGETGALCRAIDDFLRTGEVPSNVKTASPPKKQMPEAGDA